ncbi:hypothetical protein PENSPDRAFT_748311 [Peniophora sp. CONT]|nr:hypothetical protein PENSPDRAFT_748311 [Peniophora sp. CONT]
MSKRQKVPANLHAELSDYAHALRALRTTNALDVTSQLISTRPEGGSAFESDPELSDEQPRAASTEEPVASGSSFQAKKRPRKERSPSKKSVNAGDTWSRWPLPPEELRDAEWDFSEEIQAIARQSIAAHSRATREAYAAEASLSEDEEEDFDALDHSALVNMASDQLERVLSALVSFAPAAAERWANRFNGISWEAILHAISGAEIMDASIVERAQIRLEALYGPSELPLASRAALLQAEARAVTEFEFGFDYLALPHPKPKAGATNTKKDEDDMDGKTKRANEDSMPRTSHESGSDSDIPLALVLARPSRARKTKRRSVSRTTSQSQPPEAMEVDGGSPRETTGRRRSARLATPTA